jgi:hypothetical protein
MKRHALEFFGYCVGFLSLLAKPRIPGKPIPSPVDRHETGSDHRPVAGHLVQIGVIALEYRPNRPGACVASASGGRQPLGPVRIIASVG